MSSLIGPSHASHKPSKRLIFSLVLSFVFISVFMVLEFVGGLLFGSLTLLADSIHMLTDSFSLGIAVFALVFSYFRNTVRRTYGYARLEIIVTFVNGLSLIFTSIYIVAEAISRLLSPVAIESVPLLWVAFGGLLVNIVVYLLLHWEHTHEDGQRHSLLLRGTLYHVLSDILGSLLAIVAGFTVYFTHFLAIDALLSLVVVVLILYQAYRLLSKTIPILLEGTPPHLSLDAIQKDLMGVHPSVVDIHHMHLWSLNTHDILTTFHVSLDGDISADAILLLLKQMLAERYGVTHSTIQVELQSPCPDLLLGREG